MCSPARLPFLLIATAGLLVGPVAVSSQGQAEGDAWPDRITGDSTELHERARDAQRRFERERVRHLPRVWSPRSGPCDIRVGRMCQWHDPEGDWTPHPPVSRIEEAREEFLSLLARVGAHLPGDAWVLGQRVHYLAEAGRWEEALELAEGCPTEAVGWWCPALLGFVLHGIGDYPQGERTFERALAGADEEEVAGWIHAEDLLDRDARGLAEDLEGEAREAFFLRFWALADPLFLVPGNDRWTGHMARRVMARIRRDARTPFGGWFRSDMAELLVRYGWEVGWERSRGRPGSLSDDRSVVGQQHPRARRFVPTGGVLEDLTGVEPGTWIGEGRTPPATYAPAYAPELGELEAQVAVFRLGDSIVVVGAYRLPPEEDDEHDPPRRGGEDDDEGTFLFAPPERSDWTGSTGGLFLVPWAGREPGDALGVRRQGGAEGALSLRAPAGTYLLGLEHLDRDEGRAGRYRMGLHETAHPPGVPVLSDLLLLESGGELPEALDEAIAGARRGTRLQMGEPLRVAFAVYGLREREGVTLRMTLEAADPGLLRRAGEWIGVLDPERPVALDWEEVAEVEPGFHFRALEIELPELEPDRYVLRLAVALRGRTTMVTTRVLEVVP